MTIIDREAVKPRQDQMAPAAALFHSLGEHRVRELTAHLGLAQSTVSAHLACLRECGLVSSRPLGRASIFSLACDGELRRLLAAAEGLLRSTGYAVQLCTRLDGPQGSVAGTARAMGG
jgi:DNA-binding transcriptional ArsR family regulator